MSTLPFLLSVADELDNINSQSYMDDFGLGFHPHRQYYRSPTIQLSLPASTDWMEERHQRYRSHKYFDETQNNLQEDTEEDEAAGTSTASGSQQPYANALNTNTNLNSNNDEENVDNSVQMYNLSKKCCKNYHRHATSGCGEGVRCGHATNTAASKEHKAAESSYKFHSKCLEGNNSSSDESLQKVSSSIEFLTCFLLKKSRAPKTGGKKS